MLGLLDDSVMGTEYLGFASQQQFGWVLKSLWKRNMCARGKSTGKWARGLCP